MQIVQLIWTHDLMLINDVMRSWCKVMENYTLPSNSEL